MSWEGIGVKVIASNVEIPSSENLSLSFAQALRHTHGNLSSTGSGSGLVGPRRVCHFSGEI